MNLWLLLPLLLPMLAGLLLLTKPFAEGKIRRLTVQIGLILTLVSLLPAFLTSGRDLTLFTLSDNVEIALHVDGIGMCFCVLMAFVWAAAGFYSFDYMAHARRRDALHDHEPDRLRSFPAGHHPAV